MKIRFPRGVKPQEVEQEPGPLESSKEQLGPDPAPQPALPQVFSPDAQDVQKPGLSQWTRSLLKVRFPSPDLKWNQKVVTVSLEKDVIRVVTFKGKRVTGWKTTDISQRHQSADSEDGATIQGSSASRLQGTLDELGIEYGGRLWKTLDKVGFRRGRVVMDLSLYTTLMRHLQIPKVRLRYLEPVVVSEVLESLPFSKDEVDISWQLHRDKDEEGQSVYAIALPKQRVDSQVKLVKESGLVPAAAYSKASALALAAGVSDGILVHLEASETALVLVNGGEPKVVHQLELGSGGSSPDEHASTLIRAIEQVAGYYQPADPRQQSRNLPVILTGQVSRANLNTQTLLSKLRRPVLTIKPLLRYPEDFPLSEYATNLGLLLADRGGNTRRGSEPSGDPQPLNLLPRRHQPKAVPVFPAVVFIILILLAIHPFNITTKMEAKVQERDAISRQLQALKGQEKSHDLVLTSYHESNTQFEAASNEISNLETRLDDLDVEMSTLLARLSTITDVALPAGVSLSGVAPLGADFSLVGTASSHADALRYAANLKESPLFADARVIRVDGSGGANPDSGTSVSFQIRVSVPQPEDPEEDTSR
jgi:hypothetical protein